ncbi:Thymidylate kinase [Caldibacillus thermoamylovorans]|mgnify:FL=1|uniref:Thymidylate kinase n=1 Tax=Caldibacillus thermoamylovorans TaxID=35841 RepID=A0A090KML0_9BACI|nr:MULTISPECIES: dTMP kinase [Bacillaceae]KIO62015.1 Thymidylate kinase [Caldibacillus thermoamylovorans]KIO64341.1 Thymidylate kinase [Caldibacillus thermoamylovorans]KIO73647.1 Thymidylate kinase [Caldibacillus thermoamylovorans]PAC33774.1 dTMP kinase [Caldifermentibacillus hisashii]CED99899.1 Thymidylate kinase [Caldibacillus thermoamylovorans]
MVKGTFITVEGPDGAGKTTVLNIIAEELAAEGYPIVQTREPGGSPIAEKIRQIVLDKKHTEMDPRTEALLYAAARRQHLIEKIIPALEKGNIVLCDRFIDASIVYQGFARKIGIDEVLKINRFAIENTMPDLTIYFDIEPKIGLERIQKHRQGEMNRLDLETMEFHKMVREGYLQLLDRFPDRIKKVMADRPIEEVKTEAKKLILSLLVKR